MAGNPIRHLFARLIQVGRHRFCFECGKATWLQHDHRVRPFERLLREDWRDQR